MAVGDNLLNYNYEYFLNEAMDMIPDEYDKRQGSMIWLFQAPSAYIGGLQMLRLYYAYRDMYIETATGEALDNLVAFQGLERYPATYAIRKGEFYNNEGSPMEVPIGNRFATFTSSDIDQQTFVVIGPYVDTNGVTIEGQYRLQCEQPGTFGNAFPGTIQSDNRGNLQALDTVNGLATAILSDLLVAARDEETDEDLRERFKAQAQAKAFGGNVSQYIEMLSEMDGVGQVQIYPVWNGGGTVGVAILDSSGNPASTDFIAQVQQELDPENADGVQGTGIGMVPIGHWVTVTTPNEIPLNIVTEVEVSPDYPVSGVATNIKAAIENYVAGLRSQWSQHDSYYRYRLTAYYAQIYAAIVNVDGVLDMVSLTVNTGIENIEFTETGALQEIPSVGTVNINGVDY